MKRVILLIAIIMIAVIGCATVQPDYAIVAKVVGRRAGVHFAEYNLEMAQALVPSAQAVSTSEDPEAATAAFVDLLIKSLASIDDPALEADVQDLIDIVQVQWSMSYYPIIQAGGSGYVQGVGLANK